jgi:hypothetical protein
MSNLRLKIGDCDIPKDVLVYVALSIGSYPVSFGGVLQRDEGANLIKKLKLLAEEKGIPYDAVDKDGVALTGICKIVNLKFEATSTNPPMVRFSGRLAHPFIT